MLQPHRHSNHSAWPDDTRSCGCSSDWRTSTCLSKLLLGACESTTPSTFLQTTVLLTFLHSNRWFLLPQTQEDEEEDQRDEDLKGQHPLERERRSRLPSSMCPCALLLVAMETSEVNHTDDQSCCRQGNSRASRSLERRKEEHGFHLHQGDPATSLPVWTRLVSDEKDLRFSPAEKTRPG